MADIKKRETVIFDDDKKICDIALHEDEQVELWRKLSTMYQTAPEWKTMEDGEASKFRYRYFNPMFSLADAVMLHCILRFLKPNKMIEVGSGWSSAASLDTNEFYLDNSIDMTFIEPYADRFKGTLKPTDNIKLIEKGMQDIPYSVFEALEAGDLLFIDTTHVSKIGSDVNYLFFEILPRLKHGVYIHFHDIFYPFEYPQEWISRGQTWNELYLLRAFLQNNKDYQIIYFQNMMQKKHADMIQEPWTQSFQDYFYGGSLYLKKI